LDFGLRRELSRTIADPSASLRTGFGFNRKSKIGRAASGFQWQTDGLMALGRKVGGQRDLHHLPRLLRLG